MKKEAFTILFALYTFIGCQSRLDQALVLASANRVEMERVLEHYKNDDLKLQAAEFLIYNMPGHRSCDTVQLRKYYDQVEHIFVR